MLNEISFQLRVEGIMGEDASLTLPMFDVLPPGITRFYEAHDDARWHSLPTCH